MADVPVRMAVPNTTLSLGIDKDFNQLCTEVIHAYDVNIVSDTLFIFSEIANRQNPYNFKVYDLATFDYMGKFGRYGRGPGEMVSPHVQKGNSVDEYLLMNENSKSTAYFINTLSSVESENLVVVKETDLPEDLMDWQVLSENRFFVSRLNGQARSFHVMLADGTIKKTYYPFNGIDCEASMTYLSDVLLGANGDTIAEVMLFFPQINFFHTDCDQIQSVAVNKDYAHWKKILNRSLGYDSIQYYVGATTSKKYIFASYAACPLEDIVKGDYSTSIHIFDWEGNWLYNISVKEKIEAMTYDSKGRYLYAIDRTDDRLVRYDFRDLL